MWQPYSSSWGKGSAIDWNAAAERLGNHVLERCARWLILVSGVGATPGARVPIGSEKLATDEYFWGENLVGVQEAPIDLADPSKLVYLAKFFGPGISPRDYFNDHHFPNNLEEVWQSHFGFVPRATGQPLIIGASLLY